MSESKNSLLTQLFGAFAEWAGQLEQKQLACADLCQQIGSYTSQYNGVIIQLLKYRNLET